MPLRKMLYTIILMAAVAVVILFMAVSCGSGDNTPQTGCYHCLRVEGDRYFVWFDRAEDKGAEGHYYCASGPGKDSGIATRHEFKAARGRFRKVTVTCDGERTLKLPRSRFSFTPYEVPPYSEGDWKMLRLPCCDVDVRSNIVYGRARGYWTFLPGSESDMLQVFTKGYLKSFRKNDLDLMLDLYRPKGVSGPCPLILLIHGGAFYFGCKDDPAYVDMGRYYASLGYVTASIDYRLGFHVNKSDIERAGYMALQDAHAALRHLIANAKEYGIDTEHIYVAGSSAGAITALNLAFMDDESRPASSKGGRVAFIPMDDLGKIASSGNDIRADFKIRAVANMWGAVADTDLLKNGRTAIVSFHGDKDNVVPYAEGYPLSGAGDKIASILTNRMYGSACIDSTAAELGLRHHLYTFPGKGHAFNTGSDKKPNADHTFIRNHIADFFYRDMVPTDAVIRQDRDISSFRVTGSGISGVQWEVEGGFILGTPSDDSVEVLWCADKPHTIKAAGSYGCGLDWVATYKLDI